MRAPGCGLTLGRMTPARLARLVHDGDIAVLLIDHPPVNALSPQLAADLDRALDAFDAAPQARALVLACEGRTFVAGGDILAFDDPDFSAAPINVSGQ